MPITVADLMERMPDAFIPEKAEGVEAVIQFHLGEEGGDWMVTIADGECKADKGVAENPKLTLKADADDYIDIITGKLNAMKALATKKIEFKGDLNLAMKLMDMFKL